jgi:HSP20 family protein
MAMSDNEGTNTNTNSNITTNGDTDSTSTTSRQNTNTGIAQREPGRMRRLDPFSMFNEFELAMDRMLGRRWPHLRALPGMPGTETGWVPQIDMYEQGNQIVVKAELPGISKDDIDVVLEQGDLIIRGERKSEHENTEGNVYRMERSYGSFYRRIPMPEGVKEGDISASFNDGVLEVRAPSPQSHSTESPKRINIS